ncbi:putative neutral sphingomyelinase [Pectinophora gossypiella]|uniref:putative neutral sphingomyelinase n=1 Tax=Pectinophora gossypiella TaxID=13191 RepID=UPI00214EBE69|nr:putative neutral sphingomyelinase [Pectinophora gossypiella]
MEFTLNIFTLNCWGIPVVSKNRKERITAIVDYLLQSPHNIVCLQEVWSEKDYLYLKDKLKSTLPYSHYFYSGVLGSGLCVFSKWVIQDVFFHQWALNGYIHKIHHGDWFGGKGVGLCRIRYNDKLINVYCTHLHAEYHEDDIYLAHRVLQAYSTAEFVKLTSSCADVCILAGDLNAGPGDLSFRLITQIPSLLDPFDLKSEQINPMIRKPSGTSDNINNSYSDPKMVRSTPEGKRIDHILFRADTPWKASVLNFGNPLEDRVPNQPFSYSDHNAVTLEVRFSRLSGSQIHQRVYSKDDSCYDSVKEAIKVCEEATVTISKSKTLYLTVGGLLFMFLLGTVGFWPPNVLYDVTKLIITALCLYCLVMGILWNKIEMNSLKSGRTALENFSRSRYDLIAE